jgi:hypothetical protein
VGVFGREFAGFGVDEVVAAAQGAAGDLLAQQLRAEGAQPHDVGDGVGVPAFGQHGHGDDAADVGAQGIRLADGVDDFAQQVGIGQLVDALVRVALAVVALEAFDLRGEYFLEAVVDLAGVFEGIAVDQQRGRALLRSTGNWGSKFENSGRRPGTVRGCPCSSTVS